MPFVKSRPRRSYAAGRPWPLSPPSHEPHSRASSHHRPTSQPERANMGSSAEPIPQQSQYRTPLPCRLRIRRNRRDTGLSQKNNGIHEERTSRRTISQKQRQHSPNPPSQSTAVQFHLQKHAHARQQSSQLPEQPYSSPLIPLPPPAPPSLPSSLSPASCPSTPMPPSGQATAQKIPLQTASHLVFNTPAHNYSCGVTAAAHQPRQKQSRSQPQVQDHPEAKSQEQSETQPQDHPNNQSVQKVKPKLPKASDGSLQQKKLQLITPTAVQMSPEWYEALRGVIQMPVHTSRDHGVALSIRKKRRSVTFSTAVLSIESNGGNGNSNERADAGADGTAGASASANANQNVQDGTKEDTKRHPNCKVEQGEDEEGEDENWLRNDPVDGYITGRHRRWIMHPTFYPDLCDFQSNCPCERNCPETRVLMAVRAYNRREGTFRDMEALWKVSRSTIQRRKAALENQSNLVYLMEAKVDETKERGNGKGKAKKK